MLKIFTYTVFDLFRSRWTLLYTGFFLLSTLGLLALSENNSKVSVSLMNICLAIVPLIATVFGVMHFYGSREFIDLLLSQPVARWKVFAGQYLGVSLSLAGSFFLGCFIPLTFSGALGSETGPVLALILLSGVLLTFVFTALAFFISVGNENKISGFGKAILLWLFLAVIYDGLLLLIFVSLSDYPLYTPAIILTTLNPIDLARVLILLKLDVSALMGYSGAIFQKFFGTATGMGLSLTALASWIILPLVLFLARVRKKDF